MASPLDDYASRLDVNAFTIIGSPALILLCGGPPRTASGHEPSLRALLYKHLEEFHREELVKVLRAEEVSLGWQTGRHYENLLALENELAYLCAAIILIVESPGSIAELGAFSQKKILREKLIPILENSLLEEPSFIRDGPVESLGGVGGGSVVLLPWLGDPDACNARPIDPELAKDAVEQIAKEILEALRKSSGEKKFDKNEIGHQLLAVADFVALSAIVKEEEIKQFLAGLGIYLETTTLSRFLFLLNHLKVIDAHSYNRKRYYVKGVQGGEFIRYAFRAKEITADRIRLQAGVGEIFSPPGGKPIDRDREKAWKAFQKNGWV